MPDRFGGLLRDWLGALALALLCTVRPAGADETVLRVVADDNYPPYLFRNEDGVAEGYLVDYWRLWSERTGVRVDLQPSNWAEAQRRLQAGEADVIDLIFRTPPREPLYDFSPPYADLPVAIYSDVSITGIRSVATLRGFLVGVQAGDACIDQLNGQGITNLQQYANYSALIAAAQRQEIKVFCLDQYPADYYLYKAKAQHLFTKAFELYHGEFHRAVRKGNATTLRLVEAGMRAISRDEEAALRARWLKPPPDYAEYGRYLGWAILALGAGGALLLLWNLLLRGQVAARTQRLQQTLGELEAAHRETRAAQAAMLAAEGDRQFRALFDAAPVAMAFIRDEKIAALNRRFVELFGYRAGEIATLADWWPRAYPDPAYRQEVQAAWAGALAEAAAADGCVPGREYRAVRRDGETLTLLIGGQLLDDGLIVTLVDISLRKAAEAQLQLAKEEADAASAAKSSFLANMSHEIRTPLNAILGYAHLLRAAPLLPGQGERLERIEESGRHLLAVINDVLDISKIEAGRLVLEETDFTLDSVLGHVRSLIAESAAAKGLALRVDYGDLPRALRGDPTRLRQALLNYASNALKFTGHGGIVIRGRRLGEDRDRLLVRFEVEDSGIGIAAADQGGLFQAFTQVDASTTRRFGGTGLGLAITRRLAGLMGGEAGVDSRPGAGSTFWFTAWLGLGAPPPAAAELDLPAFGELREIAAGARLLLAEDDPINQELALELLGDAGLHVEVADNGAQAVERAAAAAYDLILMDMQMPEMNGIEATQAIRRLPAHAATPIIAMTANAFAEDRQRCLDAGMNDFVAKPVDPELLFATLARWLKR